MCNEYLRYRGYRSYVDQFAQTRLPLVFPPAHMAPNLPEQPSIKPTDPAPIFRTRDGLVWQATSSGTPA